MVPIRTIGAMPNPRQRIQPLIIISITITFNNTNMIKSTNFELKHTRRKGKERTLY